MTPKIKENKAFANWFRDWIAVIQQSRASVERTLPENYNQRTPVGPILRAAFGRYVA